MKKRLPKGVRLPAPRLEREFLAFHADHPEVYEALVRLARRQVRRGAKHLGIKMLWEVLRYRTMLGDPTAQYRLCNNYTAYYARLIMEQEPDLDGMFSVRELRSTSR